MTVVAAAIFVVGMIIFAIWGVKRSEANTRKALRAYAAPLVALGWREATATERWPLCFTATSEGVPWSLSIRPGVADETEDQLWWSTDSIQSREFVLVMGYSPYRALEWFCQFGVRDDLEKDEDKKPIVEELGKVIEAAVRSGSPDSLLGMNATIAQWQNDRPWFGLHAFLDAARDVSFEQPELKDVRIKARDPQMAQRLIDPSVVRAFDRCRQLLSGTCCELRIWIGASNLRLHLVTFSNNRELEVFQSAVDLGVALARSYQRATQGQDSSHSGRHTIPKALLTLPISRASASTGPPNFC